MRGVSKCGEARGASHCQRSIHRSWSEYEVGDTIKRISILTFLYNWTPHRAPDFSSFFSFPDSKRTILQLVMAKMLWFDFLPRWDKDTAPREASYPGSETVAVYGTSALFWLLAIPTLHLMLNAAVYGVAPKSIDKRYGKNLDEEEGLLEELPPEAARTCGGHPASGRSLGAAEAQGPSRSASWWRSLWAAGPCGSSGGGSRRA